jgi:hypothetical protein
MARQGRALRENQKRSEPQTGIYEIGRSGTLT